MADGKDSAEVVKFLSLYSRLKDWCDDDPDANFQLASCGHAIQGAVHASARRG
jgi:hypothetical protein